MKSFHQTKTFLIILVSVVLFSASVAASRLITSYHTQQNASPPSARLNEKASIPVHDNLVIAQAGTLAIDRQVIAGGGGTSTAGTLRLDGTVGEVGASNKMTGGSFSVSGGYWNTLDADTTQTSSTAVQFSTSSFSVNENGLSASLSVIRTGDTTGTSTVQYATTDLGGTSLCNVVSGTASSRCDYITSLGTITFGPNETTRNITVFIIDDVYPEGAETFTVTLSNPTGASLGPPSTATVTINDNDATLGVNPIDQAGFFVREHYIEFLNREPDPEGFNFWVNQITLCGADAACVEIKRINVSAAFFLSIEFQETGYLVYRFYKTGFGNLASAPVPVTFLDFLRDTQQIGQGVQVGIGNWEAQIEANKQSYSLGFVQRVDFQLAFPNSLTAQEFVDKLDTNAGGVLSPAEKANLVAVLEATPSDQSKRAQVLRAVAEDPDLRNAEFNKAFVFMQYLGYLRRNPSDLPDSNFDGLNFWLNKLNAFGGNFVNAEMVRSFLVSIEYRQRFGP